MQTARSRHPGRGERGFTMVVVALLVAVGAVAGATLLGLVRFDLSLARNNSVVAQAHEIAYGGAMEVIEDTNTPSLLPTLTTPGLTASYTPDPASPFNDGLGGRGYAAKLELLKVVDMPESSLMYSKAVVHEVSVTASSNNGEGGAQVFAEVFKTIAVQPGVQLPILYAH